MMKNKIPSKTSYLSNCDFINKYTLNHIKRRPFLSKITVELSSSDILNSLENKNKNDFNPEVKIKLFMILYLFKLFQPKIKFDTYKKVTEGNKGFLLQISYSKKTELNNFVTTLLLENWNKLISQNLTNNDKKILNFKTTIETFFGVENFLKQNLFGVNSNKLKVNCKLIFKNTNLRNQKVPIKLIKNITPFWISC